jgi:hypothetical protein
MTGSKERLEELLSEYEKLRQRPTLSTLDMAQLEHDIWDLERIIQGRGITKGKDGEMRDWFTTRYGGGSATYERRSTVFRAGPWAHKLFEQIDKKRMSLTAAIICVRRTKTLAKQTGLSAESVVQAILDQHDGTLMSLENATVDSHPNVRAPTNEPSDKLSSRSFKSKLMKFASDFADDTTSGYSIEPVYRQRLIAEFEVSLGRVVTDFLKDVTNHKGLAKRVGLEKIGSSRFNYSCEVLGLNAKFGDALDIRRVNKAFRRRAAPLRRVVDVGHNDNNEAVSAARKELEAVNQAYELLRTYVKQKELGNHVK